MKKKGGTRKKMMGGGMSKKKGYAKGGVLTAKQKKLPLKLQTAIAKKKASKKSSKRA